MRISDWSSDVCSSDLYAGPINTEHDSGNKPLRPEGYELFLDHMWYPVGADIQTRFTVDATIDGLAPDLVVVAQGDVTRTAGGVHIERDFLDIELPLVATIGRASCRESVCQYV